VIERQEAYDFLVEVIRHKGKRKEKKLYKYYQVLKTFGGYREIFKYYIVVIVEIFRKRVLSEAHSLVRAGRLDYPEQVFDLTIEDLTRALVDPSLDLRAVTARNTRFLRKIQHIRNFPQVIDSRGKILRAPRKEAKEGELVGEPISAGKVRGKVKVLSRPDEKPVLPGDILVARATDPGWTPLFLNARGIVLEVGGVLQHGALVAREYCKPCVAGVENAASILQDGQEVELDGTNGIVRLV
jgi:pyruvate,water dikinase